MFCVLIISQVPFRFLGVCVCLSPRAVCEHEVNKNRRRRGDRVVGRGSRLRDGCAWPDPRFILAVAITKKHGVVAVDQVVYFCIFSFSGNSSVVVAVICFLTSAAATTATTTAADYVAVAVYVVTVVVAV